MDLLLPWSGRRRGGWREVCTNERRNVAPPTSAVPQDILNTAEMHINVKC